MLMQQTLDKLSELRLPGMVEAYRQQVTQPAMIGELSFEERFSLLVEHEWTVRQNRLLTRLLKQARLRLPACIEDINYHQPRKLDRSVMTRLSSCNWISQHQNVLITGPTGVGKSYIACALGHNACQHRFSTRYYRVSRLLGDINLSRADGTYGKLLNNLKKVQLLILDDWGLNQFTASESSEILELFEDRYGLSSTIIVSQLPVEHWHEVINDPTLADAILDRIVHNAHHIPLDGDSMRKVLDQAKKTE